MDILILQDKPNIGIYKELKNLTVGKTYTVTYLNGCNSGEACNAYITIQDNVPSIENAETYIAKSYVNNGIKTSNSFAFTAKASTTYIALRTGSRYTHTFFKDINIDIRNSENDTIKSISGPTTITKGENVTLRVDYVASTDRDVVVYMQSLNPKKMQFYKTITVHAGDELEEVSFTVPNNIPTSGTFRYKAYIAPKGGKWKDNLGYATQNGVTVKDVVVNDTIKSISGPTTITKGDMVTLKVDYIASTERTIAVYMQSLNPKKMQFYKTITVQAGDELEEVSFTVPNNIPTSGTFRYKAYIAPKGGKWKDNLGYSIQEGVTVKSPQNPDKKFLFIDSNDITESTFLDRVKADTSLIKGKWVKNGTKVSRDAKVSGLEDIKLGKEFDITVKSGSGSVTRSYHVTTNNAPMPPKFTYIPLSKNKTDVTTRNVKSNGEDSTAAMKDIAADTDVTHWYFPEGTYTLGTIRVPSHVKFISGPGKIKFIGGDHSRGVFHLYSNVHSIKDLVIDGLEFVEGSSGNPAGYITSDGADINNLHIRNCLFDNQYRNYNIDGIKFTARNSRNKPGFRNIFIYNNKFSKFYKGAGMEIGYGYGDIDPLNRGSGFQNLHIFNNKFFNSGWAGISLTQMQKGIFIYNNDFEITADHKTPKQAWVLEINQANGASFFNNNITTSNVSVRIMSLEGFGWHSPARVDRNVVGNFNLMFRNKFDAPTSYIAIGGSDTAILENYLNTKIRTGKGSYGNIRDNQIMTDSNKPVIVYGLGDFVFEQTELLDPDFVNKYLSRGGNIDDIVSNGLFSDNNIYAKGKAPTLDNNTVESVNTFPAVPSNIGTLFPDNIGRNKFPFR